MLSVIVLTYNDPVRLRLCLHSLLRQTELDYELIVVNDGGDRKINQPVYDELRPLGRAVQEIWFGPETSEFRAAAARNEGLKRAHGERVLFLDSDGILAPNVVAEHAAYGAAKVLVNGARKHIGMQYVGMLQPEHFEHLEKFVVGVDRRHRIGGEIYGPLRERLRNGETVIPLTHHEYIWSFQMSVPTQLARQIGGFNEEFVGYGGEDQEFAARLHQAGASLLGRFDLISYHLDHPPRHQNSADNWPWLERVTQSIARPDPVRNGGPLPGPSES